MRPGKAVAETTHRLQQTGAVVSQFLADVVDMNVDGLLNNAFAVRIESVE